MKRFVVAATSPSIWKKTDDGSVVVDIVYERVNASHWVGIVDVEAEKFPKASTEDFFVVRAHDVLDQSGPTRNDREAVRLHFVV